MRSSIRAAMLCLALLWAGIAVLAAYEYYYHLPHYDLHDPHWHYMLAYYELVALIALAMVTLICLVLALCKAIAGRGGEESG